MNTIDEIFVVHHCHTDIGYTHDQPVVWDLQRRFIDKAIDLAERNIDRPQPEAFRWTVETTAPLLRWLRTASDENVARFRALEERGRIEVAGMFGNLTPLYDQSELLESLRPVRHLREEYGFEIRTGMNGDVNGHNWPLVDRLLDAGIDGFSMAVNRHWGGAPLERPLAFRWEGPSGRTLRTYNGFQYGGGYNMGIGRDADDLRTRWLPRLEDHLDRIDYDLPILMIQTTHPFFDNNPPFDTLPSFVAKWNDDPAVAGGDLPSLRLATPSEWWDAVDDSDVTLPVHRGDWTDYWNFGSITSARETAINRESRRRLGTADALEAALTAAGRGKGERSPIRRSAPGRREQAWWSIAMYDEHTWGADVSVEHAESDDTRSQWTHKAKQAYDARSASLLLRRDAIAELTRHVAEEVDE
ncbi:hypothetical protein [Haladaptatus salinisoli]|uniref:glycoside hydrolase family 38 N-terminal domain-containing protein n=1 Tax=Haladaptatus salinisoli TaxID=2884876 RepID=UPI001D0A66B5|nr:hypothetical protein [Haladaptatus salinisoli]